MEKIVINLINDKMDQFDILHQSILNLVTNQLHKDSGFELLYGGLILGEILSVEEKSSLVSSLEKICIQNMKSREWKMFNSNMILLLDAPNLPSSIKDVTQDFILLMNQIRDQAPILFYPSLNQQIDFISEISIRDITDVININYQISGMISYVIDKYINSNLFQNLDRIDIDTMQKKLNLLQKKYVSSSKKGRIYHGQFDGQKLLSIDMKHANVTIAILFFASQLFLNVEEIGIGLENEYCSMIDLLENFNWISYFNSILCELSSKLNQKEYRILCQTMAKSKKMRELVMGIIFKNKLSQKIKLNDMFETSCKFIMYTLLDSINLPMKMISITTDEIILSDICQSDILSHLVHNTLGDELNFIKKYLRVEEFVMKQYRLSNGKCFYAKHFTDKSIPSLKCIDPNDKIEAMKIVMSSHTI